ncbi:YigZ family protein [Algoriphagus sp. CAU 1675]|uniref:IMPACT family protein n=1 Tax=Algoriphagus sp. CAU 1675 TaxID=3032597 RepID=UPI0023D9AEA0|nr:YigZ family protein [Algoriphagus sp. CAU 1675]MDF2157152.1 YigZ family protein [Algoriphagus sp. CAU 1675]
MSQANEEAEYSDTFLTLGNLSNGLYKDRNSKFYYFAYPVKSEEEIKEHLADLRKKYFDARHHCYAYVLGRDGLKFRAVDDGEPNHSAGDPILGQIRSHNLTNVLIVVVRYFGGTKLGISGLIQAYKTSAALAIEENTIVEEQVKRAVSVQFPYQSMNEVMKLVKSHELEIQNQVLELDCKMTLVFRENLSEIIYEGLDNIESLTYSDIEEGI